MIVKFYFILKHKSMIKLKNDVAKKYNSTDALNDLNEITKY